MRGFGITTIAVAILAGFGLALVPRANKVLVGTVAGLAILAGITLLLQDRVTELTISGVGSIKAARARSEEDAQAIANIKNELESLASENENLKKASEDATQLLEDLSYAVDFQSTVIAADNNSRSAWDQLRVWGNDSDFPYHAEAAAAWKRIVQEHSPPFHASGFRIPWREGIDPASLSLDQLSETYRESLVELRPALLEYIWQRGDIPQDARMAFMIGVIEQDESLRAVEYAGRYFLQGASLDGSPMDVDMMLQWWTENSN